MAIICRRGMSDGPKRASAATAVYARPTPMAPPPAASTTLSMRSCRASRPRVAPSAARTPSSLDRAAPRPSSSPATFTHARTRTTVAAPASAVSVDSAVPTISSFNGTVTGFHGLFGDG